MAYRYKTVKRGGKTKLLHRHVAEQVLGRPIGADEHVHHANNQRWDNSPDNLKVLPAADHLALHAAERRLYPDEKACLNCGAIFKPKPTKRKRAKSCSTACANALRSSTEKATKARAIGAANYSERQALRAAA